MRLRNRSKTLTNAAAAVAAASRDTRYFVERLRISQLMPDPVARDIVTLGSVATFVGDDGRRMTYRILEADSRAGSISYGSPVARALIGKAPADRVVLAIRDWALAANSAGLVLPRATSPIFALRTCRSGVLLPWPAARAANGRAKAPISDRPSPRARRGARPPAGASSLYCALS